MDRCCHQSSKQCEFAYDHDKYLHIQQLCVNGYVREHENEKGLNIPNKINRMINKYMPEKEEWECFYQNGTWLDNDSEDWHFEQKRNGWE